MRTKHWAAALLSILILSNRNTNKYRRERICHNHAPTGYDHYDHYTQHFRYDSGLIGRQFAADPAGNTGILRTELRRLQHRDRRRGRRVYDHGNRCRR